ncbi:helix-turn-helix domain-containing protein [Streptomyces sp. NPDC006692]|uniref:helix-turn-helix domain-containing protein n=1 Tax=Streptomyces sp. NPDC006692 TaxID=3364758 RepID=UPI00367E7059
MRINRSARSRYFTVLGNEVLRDRRLSFTARGLLAYLLSLPDGAREDIRTLADNNPGVGRRGVAKALDELVELGYYVRRTVRDQDSGQIRTKTYVFDTPQAADAAPLPVPAGPGEAEAGRAGAFPKGNKNPDEEPTHPEPPAAAEAEPPMGRAGDTAPADTALAGRGAALLSRLGRVEPKLALSVADALALAPLANPWLDRGIPELDIRSLLTDGLPSVIHSARALLADRLVRKLPAPRTHRDAAAPAAPLVECAECRDPLPRDQQAGICGSCAGVAPPALTMTPAAAAVLDRVAGLRALLRPQPVIAAARG